MQANGAIATLNPKPCCLPYKAHIYDGAPRGRVQPAAEAAGWLQAETAAAPMISPNMAVYTPVAGQLL